MKKLIAAAAPLAAAFAVAAPAQAGTYDVSFCNAGTVFDNESWTALTSPGIVTDTACATTDTRIGIRVDAGRRSAAGAIAHDVEPARHVPRPLHVPLGGLARAAVRVPGEDPPCARLPVRDRHHPHRARAGPLAAQGGRAG